MCKMKFYINNTFLYNYKTETYINRMQPNTKFKNINNVSGQIQ